MLSFRNNQPIDLSKILIQTDRLTLQPIDVQFSEPVFHSFTPAVTKFMVPESSAKIEETNAFILASMENMHRGEELVCAILRRPSHEFLGVCGLHGRKTPATPELGIWIKEGAHGGHLGREAVQGLADWASRELALDYFIYPVDRHNVPSRKIAESLGGEVYKELLVSRSGGREPLDEVVYRIPVRRINS